MGQILNERKYYVQQKIKNGPEIVKFNRENGKERGKKLV